MQMQRCYCKVYCYHVTEGVDYLKMTDGADDSVNVITIRPAEIGYHQVLRRL